MSMIAVKWGFNELLAIISDFLPKDHILPSNYYEVKKMVKGLNLGYEKIDACEQHCTLYYGEYRDTVECEICKLPRYKTTKRRGKEKRVPKKILRYFPLALRLQRLFMSSHTAHHMRWHKIRETVHGQLTHPADGDEWKQFEQNFPEFAKEVRNVRLGMATDGFNPFNGFRQPYFVWPVIMVAYNLPPSMCIRDPYLFLTLLIPGDKSPTKDITVYIRPLVDELKMLWKTGVQTYDKSAKENFVMKAALLWTITDFSALRMVSGWSTHEKLSCPVCMGDVQALQLKHGGKASFFGTARKFLPIEYSFRKMSAQFNRKIEKGRVQGRLSGNEVFDWLSELNFPPPGKEYSKLRLIGYGKTHNWTHFCMLFELPYWVTLIVRHCIDAMHTEKNVFDNLFYTILDTSGKIKDNDKAKLDLEALNIQRELWLRLDKSKPKTPYNFTKQQIEEVYRWVSALKLPDGYVSNISRCSKKLMPIVFRKMLLKKVVDALTKLFNFFRDLCSMVIRYTDVELMKKNIVLTMCKLEMIFPRGFFDSMEHLPIHLPYELKLGGLVQYRWMYPFERYMRQLKQKMKNKVRVEGLIVERYTEEELVNFCSLYFEDFVSTKHNRLSRNEVDVPLSSHADELAVFTYPAKLFGRETRSFLNDKDLNIVSKYVLFNCSEVSSYINLFKEEAYAENPGLDAAQLEAYTTKNF